MERSNGQLIEVSASPQINALADRLRPWPNSMWVFKHDDTYVAKLADDDYIQGKTSESFPAIEVVIT